jgi:hypothetical protein
MRAPRSARPLTFFFLMLPYGIASGAVTVTLPFVVTRAGLPVATAAAIVAVAMSPNIWRFLWAPVADLTLSLRHWYGIGAAACAVTLLLLVLTPVRSDTVALLTAMAFLSQVGATLLAIPLGGLMALTVAENEKGRAGGWYQAGNLGGAGLGGGGGVWLASHATPVVAGALLSAVSLACAAAVLFVPDVSPVEAGERVSNRVRSIGREFWNMLRAPRALLVLTLILSPIGIGAASNLWAAVAPHWRATPNVVALATGIVYGLAAVAGCASGGWVADRVGRWWLYFSCGVLMALVAVGMAAAPRTPAVYTAGILSYAFTQGLGNAAFTALVLHAIGGGAATTKYAILSALGNVPVSYMTAFDGWAHDRWGAGGMLTAEALLGLVCIPLGLAALWRMKAVRPPGRPAPTSPALG